MKTTHKQFDPNMSPIDYAKLQRIKAIREEIEQCFEILDSKGKWIDGFASFIERIEKDASRTWYEVGKEDGIVECLFMSQDEQIKRAIKETEKRMHPITNYIKEKIETLRKEMGESECTRIRSLLIRHTILELQAVLSKIEELWKN